jgi:hypothetical protein
VDFGQIEQELCDRIASYTKRKFEVVPIPEVEADFNRPVETSRITVAYKSSDFNQGGGRGGSSEVKSITNLIQTEMLTFQVTIQARKLRTADGIYKGIALVRKALVGFKPSDCDKLKIAFVAHVKYEESLWNFIIEFSTTTFSVEDEEGMGEEVFADAMTLIQVEGNLGRSEVPLPNE